MTKQQGRSDADGGIGYLLKAFLLCLTLIFGFIAVDLVFFAQGASFKREGGGLEAVSAVLYGVATALFLAVAPRRVWVSLFHVPAVMILFALRELDYDKAFTGSGILSLRLYSGDAPLATKLIGGAVAAFAVYVILRNAWRGTPAAFRALRNKEIWPWFAILAGVLVVGSKSIDGLGRKLLEFGIAISDDLDATASLVEEVAEAFIPVCAILAILAYFKGARR
ncbi:hypothetical protein [Roseobacter weihaiensis]|uniref:hypothetical protein n=1 Tax=Roseobacter weihaiensis TaxID=2763262 RepID=UPI001D0A0842|nr:hypothetical protein [Roseobacter sp. H9]